MKQLLCMILVLFMYISSFAYDFTGTLSDNGNGTYTISGQNDTGFQLNGIADEQDNETLHVILKDKYEQQYTGTARDNGDGTYDLVAKNQVTGEIVTATLDKK